MKPMEMLKEIKTLLGVEETKEVSLAQMKLENGTVLEAESFEAGQEVFIVTEDEKVALPVGEYQLEDGMKLTVVDEGIIESIEEAKDEEEVEEEVEEVEEVEAAEEEKEEMGYATKEELAEVKSMIEEIKAMLEPKEDLSEEVKEDEVLKEELSAPASEPLKHNPEAKEEKTLNLHGQKRPQTTMDRVLNKIINQ
jgi:hypothetical protein